eukprot:763588-Hanusia_phi.AAC.3
MLRQFGVGESQIADMKRRSVKDTVGIMLKLQGVKLSQMSPDDPIKTCATRILQTVHRDIEMWERRRYRLITPTGGEVLDWLHQNSLMSVASVLSSCGLHTLELISKLTSNDIDRIWSACKLEPGGGGGGGGAPLEWIGLKLRLLLAVQELKGDGRSRKFGARLDAYTDDRGSVLSCIFSSNSCEIALSKPFFQLLVAMFGVGLIAYGTYVMAQPYTWYGGGRTRLHWSNYFIMAPLNEIGLGMLAMLISFAGRYHSPLVARRFARRMFVFSSCTSLLALLVEILQHSLHMHDPAWTWKDCVESGFLFWVVLCFLSTTLLSYLLSYRQEFFIFGIFIYGGVAQLLVAPKPIRDGGANKYVGYFLMVTSLASFSLIPLLLLLWFNLRKEASKFMSKDVAKYNKAWADVKQAFGIQDGIEAMGSRIKPHPTNQVASDPALLTSSIPNDSAHAFELLLHLTRNISRQVESEFRHHERKRKWQGLIGFLSSEEGSCRYSCSSGSLKARQVSSSIDQLFAQASSINEPIHELLSSIARQALASRSSRPRIDKPLRPLPRPVGAELTSPQRSEERIETATQRQDFEFIAGPVKQPLRTFQKCIRAYRRWEPASSFLLACFPCHPLIILGNDPLAR